MPGTSRRSPLDSRPRLQATITQEVVRTPAESGLPGRVQEIVFAQDGSVRVALWRQRVDASDDSS